MKPYPIEDVVNFNRYMEWQIVQRNMGWMDLHTTKKN